MSGGVSLFGQKEEELVLLEKRNKNTPPLPKNLNQPMPGIQADMFKCNLKKKGQ